MNTLKNYLRIGNVHEKITTLAIREMQNKVTMRYHYTPMNSSNENILPKKKRKYTHNPNDWWEYGATVNPFLFLFVGGNQHALAT